MLHILYYVCVYIYYVLYSGAQVTLHEFESMLLAMSGAGVGVDTAVDATAAATDSTEQADKVTEIVYFILLYTTLYHFML